MGLSQRLWRASCYIILFNLALVLGCTGLHEVFSASPEYERKKTLAKPAFIYAFDSLGPERFTEICGLLLASRYKGFLLGGVGPDGGIDAEVDEVLGIWQPESVSPLQREIIQPGQVVVFQFKHKVTARVGQAQSRNQLLSLYKCTSNRTCEIHKELIIQHAPSTYVLVTNVEVNSNFRNTFIEQCKTENPEIEHYQIIGLDELETWVTMDVQLRHLYFPTIFEPPRFNLKIQISDGFGVPYFGRAEWDLENTIPFMLVSVLNVGLSTSYISRILIRAIVDGELKYFFLFDFEGEMTKLLNNPQPGASVEPGRKLEYRFPFEVLQQISADGNEVFPVEVLVYDEIENVYSSTLSDNLRSMILGN